MSPCRRSPGIGARGGGAPPEWLIEAATLRALRPRHILFLCVANSARSQMAEGIGRSLAPPGVTVSSAGSEPAFVRPQAIQVLKEIGVDISGHRSKGLETIEADSVEAVVTLCAEEVCPAFLGKGHRVHWGLPDPAAVVGTEDTRLAAFRDVRDEILLRLKVLFEGMGETYPGNPRLLPPAVLAVRTRQASEFCPGPCGQAIHRLRTLRRLMRKSAAQKNSSIAKSIGSGITHPPPKAPCRMSAPYVNGSAYDTGRRNAGSRSTGKNRPQRKIMGKRKKFENVCASKTSLTETAMSRPRKVDATAISTTAGTMAVQATPERSARNTARMTGTKALAVPKRIAPDDPPGHEERDAAAQALRLLDIVRGQEDRLSGLVEIGDRLPDPAGAVHVDPRCGLVEKQDRRIMNDSGRDGELALHALGVARELSAGRLGQAETLQQLARPPFPGPFAHSVQRAAEAQVVEPGQLGVQVALIRHHAHQVLGGLGVARAVDAGNPDDARVRPGQAGQHVDGGRFPRAVRPEEAENLASGNDEGDPVHRRHVGEALLQVFNRYRRRIAHGCILADCRAGVPRRNGDSRLDRLPSPAGPRGDAVLVPQLQNRVPFFHLRRDDRRLAVVCYP